MALTEAQKRYKSAWRKANRDKENAYARKYRSDPARYAKHMNRVRAHYVANRDAILTARKEQYAADPAKREMHKAGNLQWLYGITLEQFQELLNKQGHACAICRKPETNKRRKNLSVDHDHATGKVRALLCASCNLAVGLVEDDPARALRIIAYLEAHASVS